MKNFIPLTILGFLALSGLFFAFTDSSDSELISKINFSNTVIANQTACIDDIEASLYDFSFEIMHLRAQNEFLEEENQSLRLELQNQTKRASDLREKMLHLEVESYDLKRQLEQVLIGREIRARHQSNSPARLDIADGLMPTPDMDSADAESNMAIHELQTKINTIETELVASEETLETISALNKETIAAIEANESKIEFNIEIDPASDPAVEFSDPLVSQEVLFNEPTDATAEPKFFTEISINNENIAAVAQEDEFSSKSPIFSLVENTDVVYNYIACRNDRYGKKIKKLRKDGKNWKYTFLQFNLETENINLLLNKQFRMRVLSTDLNTYVNFNTDKTVKTISHYDFEYEGEPIKVSFFNKEVKGNSFEIQIFHIVDGKEYLLEDDQHTLFTDGVNVQNKMAYSMPK